MRVPIKPIRLTGSLGEFDRKLEGRHTLFYCGDVFVFFYLIGKNETLKGHNRQHSGHIQVKIFKIEKEID